MAQKKDVPCVTIIGMPGAGKTTIGMKLASALGWTFMDCDYVIESIYAARLQAITDALGKERFLNVECEIISRIKVNRCVIATGGSVVYRQKAVRHLAGMGPIIHIELALPEIEKRVSRNPERGIAIAPGQTLADIYKERAPLYANAASIVCDSNCRTVEECVNWILGQLSARYQIWPEIARREETAG